MARSLRCGKLGECPEHEVARYRGYTLTAAVAGLGALALAMLLIDNDIREGRLLEAWPRQTPMAAGYHLILASELHGTRPRVRWRSGPLRVFKRVLTRHRAVYTIVSTTRSFS